MYVNEIVLAVLIIVSLLGAFVSVIEGVNVYQLKHCLKVRDDLIRDLNKENEELTLELASEREERKKEKESYERK